MRKFKKGDKVKVWSLQSFNGGGFLNGVDAFVTQDQNCCDSVILAVIRNINGVYKLDKSYEVYSRQCELVEEVPYEDKNKPGYIKALSDFKNYFEEIFKRK